VDRTITFSERENNSGKCIKRADRSSFQHHRVVNEGPLIQKVVGMEWNLVAWNVASTDLWQRNIPRFYPSALNDRSGGITFD
jgi:hypothetical protein